MGWTKIKIKDHKKAARLLLKIKDKAFDYIRDNKETTEYEVSLFVLQEFKRNNLETDENNCIIAFQQNTSFVHYYPSQYCRRMKPNSLIMIDIWARLKKKGARYADITWMAYYGDKIPKEVQKVFDLVISAQDAAIKFIKKELRAGKLPVGRAVDEAARQVIREAGLGEKFKHTLGHSLGDNHPHGKTPGLRQKNIKRLQKNIGYTIEPGVYLDNKFGVRSELDFYIDDSLRFKLTSKKQSKIIKI